MAKIQLSTKVKLDITDNGKVIKTFNVTYKEPTRKQRKQIGKENQEIIDTFSKGQSLIKRSEVLESKVKALESLEDSGGLLATTNKLETIYNEQDALDAKFEELGGVDKLLEASKLTYDFAVGGKDKEALAEFAEDESDYGVILSELAADAKEQKGKHS